ncbi:DegT/DnrJ/EryC1/StrS family aminotransferase [Planomicrobium okeanokoites]|uniref:DegT/DnrJ/EryC1/StrS family aminotransferase n=1 Tax=Planomicrobium okeanokoites TaxID=244 RepID=UPI0031EF088F
MDKNRRLERRLHIDLGSEEVIKMNIQFSPPDISEAEINAVIEVLRSGWITTGPKTKLFEKTIAEYVNTPKAVCLNSGTAAMELTLRILGVGEGDEVITSAYTYTATASVIQHVGAKIVLIDTAPDSYEMNYDLMEQAITSKTKAILPVDIAGVMCDYNRIFEAVNNKKHLFVPASDLQQAIGRITVIADAAHSFGASYNGRKSGEVADFTCFSFHAVKNLTTCEGGAVTWNSIASVPDEEIYRHFMLLSLHGQSKDALAKAQTGSCDYDIIYPGYKCNMTDIAAAIGLAQFSRYPELLKKRREIIETYDRALANSNVAILQHYTVASESSGHLYLVRMTGMSEAERSEIIRAMAEKGISTNIHYKPLPMLTAYKNMGFDIKDFPYAHLQYLNEISLPVHTLLSEEDVLYICDSLNSMLLNRLVS